MAPPPVPGPSSVRNHGGGRTSGNYGTQSASSGMSAPPVHGSLQLHIRREAPRRPPSPSRTRRPHSDTDEEEERPKKKRQKRPLQNPDPQKVILSANQRENATHQRHSGRASLSSAAASGSHRQVTVTVPFPSKNSQLITQPLNQQYADKLPRNGGLPSSVGKPHTPLSQAQARAARPLTQSASARGKILRLYALSTPVNIEPQCLPLDLLEQAASH